MRRNLLYTALCASSLWAITACSDDVVVQENNDTGKTPIELSVGGINEEGFTSRSVAEKVSRAVITDGTNKTMKPFTAKTRLFLFMKSEEGNTDENHVHNASAKYGLSFATAAAAESGSSAVTTAPAQQLYWDDAHSRCSQMTVYAWGVANKERTSMDINYGTGLTLKTISSSSTSRYDFSTSEVKPVIHWEVAEGANHDYISQDDFVDGDLIFSNNTADNTSQSKPDGRLKFNGNVDPSAANYRKFDKADLKFYHALSQITVKVVMGEGFTADDFKFKTGTNVALKGFFGKGIFDISKGEFDVTSLQGKNFDYLAPQNPTLQTDGGTKQYVLRAYVVPGTDLTETGVEEANKLQDAMTLIVKDSKYTVSMATLYQKLLANTANQESSTTIKDAVLTDGKKTKAGVNYEFTLTIGKSKINSITAQVADWETVTSENIDPKTTTVSVTTAVLNDNKTNASNFDLYRLPYISNASDINLTIQNYDWVGRYTDKATLSGPSSNVWATNWYFESLKHFYHFRAVSPKAATQGETTVQVGGTGQDDYLNLTSASVTTTPSATYTDVLWGAPFTGPTGTGNKYTYDPTNNGFDGTSAPTTHQIHHGITTTTATINLLMFHMMSDVTFNVTTTTGEDKVQLKNGDTNTKVELIGYYSTGKVHMGNGKVETTGSASTSASATNLTIDTYTAEVADPATAAKSVFHYGAVPQDLTNVVLRITTPDNNIYEVDLKDVWVASSSISNNNLANPYTVGTGDKASKYNVNRWYPGFKYTYNLTLKKKGISDITATILGWETVEASNDDIQIK